MDFNRIQTLLNIKDLDSYYKNVRIVINELITYINNCKSDDEIYYNFLNFTGLNIPSADKSTILTDLFNQLEKLRYICFKKALEEIKFSMEKIFGVLDDIFVNDLRNAILGEDFVLEGYSTTSWDKVILLLDSWNELKMNQVTSSDQIVFWSKINDHSSLNSKFLTIESSTFGGEMYFLDLVFNNWSSDLVKSPKLEELWKKISKLFTKNALKRFHKDGIDYINFYCEYCDSKDYFGDIFLSTELPLLINSGINQIIVHIVDHDNKEIQNAIIDLESIRSLGDINNISVDILRKVLKEQLIEKLKVEKK